MIEAHQIISCDQAGKKSTADLIAQEEILSIDIDFGPMYNRTTQRLTSLLRTPGHDEDLVLGLLYTLGIIHHAQDVLALNSCRRGKLNRHYQQSLTASLAEHVRFSPQSFNFFMPRFSGCGMCSALEIDTKMEPKPHQHFAITPSLLTSLADKTKKGQTIFNQTGGTHMASLFDKEGRLLKSFEDVGRHNALDKLIGFMMKDATSSLSSTMVMMSSRASFEIIHKAAMARIPLVATFSAVSSMAIKLALASGITLVGFLRDKRFNVYSHAHRIIS